MSTMYISESHFAPKCNRRSKYRIYNPVTANSDVLSLLPYSGVSLAIGGELKLHMDATLQVYTGTLMERKV